MQEHYQILPAGFKQRGVRVRDEASPIQPGEFKDVDAPGGNLRDAFFPLPYKEPSQTLLQLNGCCSWCRSKIRGYC